MSALGDRVIIGNPLPFLHWAQIRDYDNHVIATVVAFTHRRLMQRLPRGARGTRMLRMMLWLVGGTADERNGAIEALETAGHVAETTDPMDTYADMSTAVFVTIDHLTAKREDGTLEFDGVATLPGWASDPLALAHVAVLSGCLGKPVLPVGVWITPTEGEADGKDD